MGCKQSQTTQSIDATATGASLSKLRSTTSTSFDDPAVRANS